MRLRRARLPKKFWEQCTPDIKLRVSMLRNASKSTNELYLSFSLSGGQIRILLSQKGGVDIEDTFAKTPEAIVSETIDILTGLTRWQGH